MPPNPNLALENRRALPDALRALLAEYPREGWAADPHFQGLVAFWLDRHMMFRKIMDLMQADTQALLDRALDRAQFSGNLRRLGGMFVNDLHGHHQIEDQHYFPALAAKEASIAKGFEILDHDHHAIDGYLAGFVRSANGVLQNHVDRSALQDAAGLFHADLLRLQSLLNRHLIDEEELIVPIILRHGAGSLG
jgi:iron-sulfur cluster repair protein YtfE (RIC family)